MHIPTLWMPVYSFLRSSLVRNIKNLPNGSARSKETGQCHWLQITSHSETIKKYSNEQMSFKFKAGFQTAGFGVFRAKTFLPQRWTFACRIENKLWISVAMTKMLKDFVKKSEKLNFWFISEAKILILLVFWVPF